MNTLHFSCSLSYNIHKVKVIVIYLDKFMFMYTALQNQKTVSDHL